MPPLKLAIVVGVCIRDEEGGGVADTTGEGGTGPATETGPAGAGAGAGAETA